MSVDESDVNYANPHSSILDWNNINDDSIAIATDDKEISDISYGELKRMISLVFSYLHEEQNILRGSRIGLLVANTASAIAVISNLWYSISWMLSRHHRLRQNTGFVMQIDV